MPATKLGQVEAEGVVRRVLDRLYLAGGIAGAACIVGIALLIIAQIVGRLIDVNLPGSDDLTAWLVAASAFFALAYTFRHGGHIRVTLVVERLHGVPRRVLEIACLATATFFVGWLAAGLVDLVRDSWRWNDVAQGLLPIPMWIPQSTAALGACLLLVALVDDLVASLRGGSVSYLASRAAASPDDTA